MYTYIEKNYARSINTAEFETDTFFFPFQDSHSLSELSHQQQQQQQQQKHSQQQYTHSSSSTSSGGGGTAENPVDLSNSRPPPHDQRGANGLLHESSKLLLVPEQSSMF